MPRGRRWLFRLAAALLLPLLLLGATELALRLAGWGYPTSFFLKTRLGGQEVYTENRKFAFRFFPPALARAPEPQVLSVQKPADVCRIVVFGESAALGDPEPAYGLPRLLEVLLSERFPGTRFEVLNTAMTAINSHVMVPIAKDARKIEADVWVLYVGHNEVHGPFGAGTVFGPQTPGLAFIRASVALKQTRLGQGLAWLLARLRGESKRPQSWKGMEMFTEQQVRATEPRLQKVYRHFRQNLEDILRLAKKAGAKVVLCTTASNLKDCPPFGSVHGVRLAATAQAEWEQAYKAGLVADSEKKFEEAIDRFQQAAKLDDQFAALRFGLGRAYYQLGKAEEARQHLVAARDLDTLRFRADSTLNRIVREVAEQRKDPNVLLVDVEQVIARESPDRVPGEELFYEHVHFNFDGNYHLSQAVAQGVEKLLAVNLARSKPASSNYLSLPECAERVAFTGWNRLQILRALRPRMQTAPFNQQLDHEKRDAALRQTIAELAPQVEGAALEATVQRYRQAIVRRGDDWVLHDRFAQLLVAARDPVNAEKHFQRTVELIPHASYAYYQLGNFYEGQGKSAEAEKNYRLALSLRPESAEAQYALGLALNKQGQTEEAIRCFARALELNPELAEAHDSWGTLLAQKGQTQEAIKHLEEALRLKPDRVSAHVTLGRLLGLQQKNQEALDHFSAAVRSSPNDPSIHFYVATALFGLGKTDEAIEYYLEAVRLSPTFAEAHSMLGSAYLKKARTDEAVKHLFEAIRLKPGLADAHLNLGIAYVQQERHAEAAREFEETLRLEPGNAKAKKYLLTLRRAMPSVR